MKKIVSSADIDEPRYLVRHRIGLVKKINVSNRNQHDGPDELVYADGQWYAIPGKDYQWLRCYLLLTCFDILGRLTTEWADFYSWLTQKMNIDPYSLVTVGAEKDKVEYQTLYHNYNPDVAVRNNFFHFVNTVISNRRRVELLSSINLTKKDKLTDALIPSVVSDSEKLNFLFNIRNTYIPKEKQVSVDNCRYMGVGLPNQNKKELQGYYFMLQWNPALLLDILEEALEKKGPEVR